MHICKILFTQGTIPCRLCFLSHSAGAAREGSVCRAAVGEQWKEEASCGCQPFGTSPLCHTFRRAKGRRNSKPLESRKSCALLTQSLVSYSTRSTAAHPLPLPKWCLMAYTGLSPCQLKKMISLQYLLLLPLHTAYRCLNNLSKVIPPSADSCHGYLAFL